MRRNSLDVGCLENYKSYRSYTTYRTYGATKNPPTCLPAGRLPLEEERADAYPHWLPLERGGTDQTPTDSPLKGEHRPKTPAGNFRQGLMVTAMEHLSYGNTNSTNRGHERWEHELRNTNIHELELGQAGGNFGNRRAVP